MLQRQIVNTQHGDDSVTEQGRAYHASNICRKYAQESRLRAMQNIEYRMWNILRPGYVIGCQFRGIDVSVS